MDEATPVIEPVEETKDGANKIIASILISLVAAGGGTYLITEKDKIALEEANQQLQQELDASNNFAAENIVDQSGVPVFDTHGEITKVVITHLETGEITEYYPNE